MSLMDDEDFGLKGFPDERELPDEEVDARFRELTADLPDPVVEMPVRPAVDASSSAGLQSRRVVGPRDWPTTPEVEELEDAQTHFIPPVPPPLRVSDRWTHLAWCALITGIVLLLSTLLLPRSIVTGRGGSWLGLTGSVLFVGALTYLVFRMPRVRSTDQDETGAVV